MNLQDQVLNTLKLKRSNFYCASKLGISVEKYKEIKRKILNGDKKQDRVTEVKENIEEGTALIKGVSSTEPRTAEQIIEILKIDTTKWKLSIYWNKENGSGWMVSAMVTKLKKEPIDYLVETLKNFNPVYKPITKVLVNDNFDNPVAGILSIQDLHIGKEGNATIEKDFKDAVSNVVYRGYMSHYIDKIIYVIGGDLLNMDTFSGTTTAGTPLDNDMRAQEAYNKAFDLLYWSINFIKQFCKELHVVYLPGNHDRLSSYHMAHSLSKCFYSDNDIKFDVEYAERKVITYGSNFFGLEHGDVTKKNTPLVYAIEFPIEWGNTKFRTCYTGHWHSKKTTEYITENEHNGFSIKSLPSLCSSDYWHYHNKFVGAKRQVVFELHSMAQGKVSEFTYNV